MSYSSLLKTVGLKNTKIRSNILQLLLENLKPCSAAEMLKLLKIKGIQPNKTTVYRELEVLLAKGIIKEVFVNGKVRYFEVTEARHHHHLICLKCNKMIDFTPAAEIEATVKRLAKKLAAKNKYQLVDHSLEFFGLCPNCK